MISQLTPQTFDLVMVSCLGVATIFGVICGMSRIVLALGSWVGAITAVAVAFPMAHTFAKTLIANDLLAGLAAGASVFIVAFSILVFMSNSLAAMIRASALGSIDRALGLLTGGVLAAGVLCGAGIFAPWIFDDATQVRLREQSKLYGYLEQGSQVLVRHGRQILASIFPEASEKEPPAQEGAEDNAEIPKTKHRHHLQKLHHRASQSTAGATDHGSSDEQTYERLANPPVAKKSVAADAKKPEKGYALDDRDTLKELSQSEETP